MITLDRNREKASQETHTAMGSMMGQWREALQWRSVSIIVST